METISDLFALTQTGDDSFIAPNGRAGWISQYGGQVIAQALAAAAATVADDRSVNSLHAYFLRPGAFDVPIALEVQRERDGGSFSNRRVVASQGGAPILSLLASFHTGERGPARQADALPPVPSPDDLPVAGDAATAYGRDPGDPSPLSWIDVRAVEGAQPFTARRPEPPHSKMWVRFRDGGELPSSLARTLVAYLSDLFLINTGLQPHRAEIGRKATITSLDHAIWFHGEPRLGEWMLVVQDSDWAGAGRVMLNAKVLSSDGILLATIAQEGLLRLR
jgi:acyl-CoA thioesterase-2